MTAYSLDLVAVAEQLIIYLLVGCAFGFGLGSIWKWFQWIRG